MCWVFLRIPGSEMEAVVAGHRRPDKKGLKEKGLVVPGQFRATTTSQNILNILKESIVRKYDVLDVSLNHVNYYTIKIIYQKNNTYIIISLKSKKSKKIVCM